MMCCRQRRTEVIFSDNVVIVLAHGFQDMRADR